MKKLIALLVFFSTTGLLSAQTTDVGEYKKNNEVKTIMNSIEIHRISGFGGPTMSYSTVNGEFAFMMGGGGGIIINNFFLADMAKGFPIP